MEVNEEIKPDEKIQLTQEEFDSLYEIKSEEKKIENEKKSDVEEEIEYKEFDIEKKIKDDTITENVSYSDEFHSGEFDIDFEFEGVF